MSASVTFNQSASTADYRQSSRKRAAPFSIRLSLDERARLAMEAAGAPLGAYIKAIRSDQSRDSEEARPKNAEGGP